MAEKLRLEVLLAAVDKVTGPLKAIQTGSHATTQALGETELALKKLQRQQRLLQKLGDAKPDLIRERDKLRVLKEQLSAMRAQGTASKKQLESKEKEVAQQSAAYERQRAAVMRLRSEVTALGLGSASQAQTKLATSIAAANTQIDAQRHKLEQQRQVEGRLAALREKHGATMMKLAKWGGAAVGAQMAGQKIQSALASPVTTFAKAETEETQLRISFMQKDGSVVGEFQQILDKAEELGDRLPGSTADFIKMMTVLRKEGMTAKAVVGGLGEAAANLGVLMQVDPTEAAAKMAKMQDSLRATEAEMPEVADLMQRANYLGADMAFMQSAIGNAAPMLDVMKAKGAAAMRVMAPFMVMMNQAGMEDGGSVGNAARKIFDRAMDKKKVDKANAVIAKTGGRFKLGFTDGKGEFGGLGQLFKQLEQLRKLSTQDRGMVMNALWGDDAETNRTLSKWIADGKAGYEETAAKMAAQADLAQRVAAMLDTLENHADAAGGSWSNLLKSLGQSIAPELKAILDTLGELANGIKQWVKENPRIAKTFMLIAAGSAAVLTVMGTLGIALVGVLGSMAMLRLVSGRFLLNLLGMHVAGGAAAAGTGKAAQAMLGLATAWGKLKAGGLGKLLGGIGTKLAQLAGKLPLLSKLGGLLGSVFRLVFAFARTNPLAAIVLGLGGLFAGLYAHWDKIKAFWNKGEWGNLAKEIWAAVEWGLNGSSGGLYEFFKSIALKAMTAVWDGIKGAVGADDASRLEETRKGMATAFNAVPMGPAPARQWEARGLVLQQPGDALRRPGEAASTPLMSLAPKAALQSPAVSSVFHNTFNITTAPGMDERALARAVTTEMQRQEQRNATRRRSSFSDIE